MIHIGPSARLDKPAPAATLGQSRRILPSPRMAAPALAPAAMSRTRHPRPPRGRLPPPLRACSATRVSARPITGCTRRSSRARAVTSLTSSRWCPLDPRSARDVTPITRPKPLRVPVIRAAVPAIRARTSPSRSRGAKAVTPRRRGLRRAATLLARIATMPTRALSGSMHHAQVVMRARRRRSTATSRRGAVAAIDHTAARGKLQRPRGRRRARPVIVRALS